MLLLLLSHFISCLNISKPYNIISIIMYNRYNNQCSQHTALRQLRKNEMLDRSSEAHWSL